MARVIVQIETEHESLRMAVESVTNSLRRAGYDILGATVANYGVSDSHVRATIQDHVQYADLAFVSASEPECDSHFRRA